MNTAAGPRLVPGLDLLGVTEERLRLVPAARLVQGASINCGTDHLT